MPKNQTTITSDIRKELPARGRSKKTLIIEAIKEKALLTVDKDAKASDVEKAWFAELIKKAMNPDDGDSGLCLRLVTERGWAALKPSSENVEFEFDPNADPHIQAAQVMHAIAEGNIPPDLGLAFVGGIKSMLDIEEVTELKERLEAIEKELGING